MTALDALQLKCSAKELVEGRGCSFKAKNGIPRDEWFQAFIERIDVFETWHNLRTPNVLSRLRAAAGNEENITHYYQLLQLIVHGYHINVSSNIGNLDETFIHFDLKSRKVIAERNAKSVLSSTVGEQLEHITPCQIEIIHKVYPPVLHVLYACVYMLRIHLMYNLCSRSKYTCYPLWCITRVALDV